MPLSLVPARSILAGWPSPLARNDPRLLATKMDHPDIDGYGLAYLAARVVLRFRSCFEEGSFFACRRGVLSGPRQGVVQGCTQLSQEDEVARPAPPPEALVGLVNAKARRDY